MLSRSDWRELQLGCSPAISNLLVRRVELGLHCDSGHGQGLPTTEPGGDLGLQSAGVEIKTHPGTEPGTALQNLAGLKLVQSRATPVQSPVTAAPARQSQAREGHRSPRSSLD